MEPTKRSLMVESEDRPLILIVEDQTVVAADLATRLVKLGYDVVGLAANHDDALSMARELKPDLVLMDIVLDGDKDGIDAAEAIRNETRIPVVFLTGHFEGELLERAKHTHPFGYVAKPVIDQDLRANIEMARYVSRVEREREEAEQTLRRNEERYRTIFENAPLGLFRSTLEGRFIEVNPALAALLGYPSPADLLSQVTDIAAQVYVRPEERRPLIEKSLHSDGVLHHLTRFKRRDGSEFWASFNFRAARGPDGRPEYIEGIIEDVTTQRRMEEQVRESEEKYRQLFKNAPAGIFELDLIRRRLLHVNHVACTQLGYGQSELLAMNPLQLFSRDGRRLLTGPPGGRAGEEEASRQVECEMIGKDGRGLWVLATARYRYENGMAAGASIVMHDITGRKLMEDLARRNEERFRLIANNSVDSAFFHDLDLKYIWITKAFEPFTVKEIMGRTDLALMGNEYGRELFRFKQQVLEQKKEMRSEFRVPRPDGGLSHFEITCSPRTNLDGSLIGLSGFMRDVSARKLAEEEVRRREVLLQEERKNLEEANAAFKLLLKHRDEEKSQLQEDMQKKINNLVLPYLQRLKGTHLDQSQMDLIDIVEQSLAALDPGTAAREAEALGDLTPREMEVAGLIRMGHGSKKISELLGVSEQTVAFHRKNIRKKLGLSEQGRNLRSFLLTSSR